MKFIVVALSVLAVANANSIVVPSTGSGALAKDVQDLVDLVPVDKVKEITRQYLLHDNQFQTVLKLLGSSEFKQFLRDYESVPEFKDMTDKMQELGLDMSTIMRDFNNVFDVNVPAVVLDLLKPLTRLSGGIQGYRHDILAVIPVDTMAKMFDEKRKNSKAMSDLIKEVLSPKYQSLMNEQLNNVHLKNVIQAAVDAGIDSYDIQHTLPLVVIGKLLL